MKYSKPSVTGRRRYSYMMNPTAARINEIAEGIKQGNRRALARGITLIESRKEEDQHAGQQLLEQMLPHSGNSVRVGISGVPGVGKSTFIEALGLDLTEQGHRVAVLAVDPSSPYSGGSIMGDKTRMQELTNSESAFIRPSPTGGTLGGVARRTRESMLLCEAAGYDIVIVETVGVGQSEYEVADMVDFFLVMLLPGGGDELQGIKRGIIEVADMLVINKAEGDQLELAKTARREYRRALKLVASDHDDPAEIMLCSALQREGIREIWQQLEKLTQQQKKDGRFDERRKQQLQSWLEKLTEQTLLQKFWQDDEVKALFDSLQQKLEAGEVTPLQASRMMLERYLRDK